MTIFVIVGVVIICSFLPLILSNFLPANHGAAVFADVTSANVVGYQNLQLNPSSYTMVGGTFASIAGEDGQFCMNDLKVKVTSTYEPRFVGGQWRGGMSGDAFEFQILNAFGSADATYYWQYSKSGTFEEPVINEGWFKKSGGGYVPLEKDELEDPFDPGQGFWIAGSGCSLVPAGQVAKEGVHFVCNPSSYTSVGNGTPVDVTLKDVSVTVTSTYEPRFVGGQWRGGMSGDAFELQFLNSTGGADQTYYWNYNKTGTFEEPVEHKFWTKKVGGEYIQLTDEDAAKIPVPAGKCFWVSGVGCTVDIDAPTLN